MSNKLLDIVNFNADASCLENSVWINSLIGGVNSKFCKYLKNYVQTKSKVNLGFSGATLIDIKHYNPEAIDLINQNEEYFCLIVRPFAHDIALLRTEEGFRLNLELGIEIATSLFKNLAYFYLPPEFMLTNAQVNIIKSYGFNWVLINPGRFNDEISLRIPDQNYQLEGLFEEKINCIPFNSNLTKNYLLAMQQFEFEEWNQSVLSINNEHAYIWRDGESPFLIPNGIHRELLWLENESSSIERLLFNEIKLEQPSNKKLKGKFYKNYPVHSFHSWMREMRMLGFIQKVNLVELKLNSLSNTQRILWLLLINSDILSAVEKNSPIIQLKELDKKKYIDFTINRTQRYIEGEELLELINSKSENFLESFVQENKNTNRLAARIFILQKGFIQNVS
ncbi:MAG: hypothetical protein ACJAZ3_000180 [Sphingobacteriales bacterium]|jgi:hypothetical protein